MRKPRANNLYNYKLYGRLQTAKNSFYWIKMLFLQNSLNYDKIKIGGDLFCVQTCARPTKRQVCCGCARGANVVKIVADHVLASKKVWCKYWSQSAQCACCIVCNTVWCCCFAVAKFANTAFVSSIVLAKYSAAQVSADAIFAAIFASLCCCKCNGNNKVGNKNTTDSTSAHHFVWVRCLQLYGEKT